PNTPFSRNSQSFDASTACSNCSGVMSGLRCWASARVQLLHAKSQREVTSHCKMRFFFFVGTCTFLLLNPDDRPSARGLEELGLAHRLPPCIPVAGVGVATGMVGHALDMIPAVLADDDAGPLG